MNNRWEEFWIEQFKRHFGTKFDDAPAYARLLLIVLIHWHFQRGAYWGVWTPFFGVSRGDTISGLRGFISIFFLPAIPREGYQIYRFCKQIPLNA